MVSIVDGMDDNVAAANEMLAKMKARDEAVDAPEVTAVRFFKQGQYTVALINDCAIGVSKRNPIDPYSRWKGERIALYRAVQELVVQTLLPRLNAELAQYGLKADLVPKGVDYQEQGEEL